MDPVLQQARETLICSQEWEDLNRELLSQLQHLEHLHGEGNPRKFSSLSDVEKVSAVGMTAGLLEKTKAFSELQAKVSTTVEEQLRPVGTRPARVKPSGTADGVDRTAKVTSRSKLPVQKASRACSHLLLEWPYLVHHLKKCFNHPFPPGLRAVAWRVLLEHVQPTVKNDFLARADHQVGYVATTPEETRISHRCSETLLTNPVYHDIANSAAVLRAMRNIMLYWSRMSGSMVSDAELVVCIPFLYVRREELSEQYGKAQDDGLSTISEIATQCVRFLKMLPLSVAREKELEAMNKFSLEVERLLSSEEPVLYQALQKTFGHQTSTVRAPSSISQESQLPFHKRLSNVIHPHVRRMLVGDVSMEVLCFIWDQCFIGWDTPSYRFMPHAIVVWLILVKDKLMSCHSTKGIEQALAANSATLTIGDFQKEIEKRFLRKLSSQLRITPLKRKVRRGPSNRSGLGLSTGECEATPHEDPEKALPKGGIAGLQRELEEDPHSLLNTMLDHEENEDNKEEITVLRREVAALRMKAAELSVSRSVSQTTAGVTAIPTNSTLLSPLSTTTSMPASPEQRAHIDVPVSIPVNQNTPRAERQDGSLSHHSDVNSQLHSPLHLTEREVQDIWLKLLGRFTEAAYTVCHGTGEEKHRLYTSSTTLEET